MSTVTKHRLGAATILAGLLAAIIGVSCAADTGFPAGNPPGNIGTGMAGGDENGGGGCSLAQVQTIFTAHCAGTCHSASVKDGGLDLSASGLKTRLVDVTSHCSGKLLVSPGNAASSYLLDKLQGGAGCGAPMPKGQPALDATSINCVADWIDGLGASSGGTTPGGGTPPGGGGPPGGGW